MFSIKSVYITVPHESHNTILWELSRMAHVAHYGGGGGGGGVASWGLDV